MGCTQRSLAYQYPVANSQIVHIHQHYAQQKQRYEARMVMIYDVNGTGWGLDLGIAL